MKGTPNKKTRSHATQIESNQDKSRQAKKVVMYSAEWCAVCKQAKQYFRKKGIRYKAYDIDKSGMARQKFLDLRARGVPVIFVDKARLNGFTVASFERLYFPNKKSNQ